jgi:putative transposase
MARAWRIEFEGALYHVVSRGNERRDIFFSDDDRRLFLDTLGEMAQRFEMELFAYVLMNNHYHLLLSTRRANLSRAMQWFGVTYTNRFNAINSRIGHLFQGRFKSMLVQNDAYLMRLSLYIHRNPLRAGIVNRLVDYRWSSYRSYAYGKKAPEWLNTERILCLLQNVRDRHAAYREQTQRYSCRTPRTGRSRNRDFCSRIWIWIKSWRTPPGFWAVTWKISRKPPGLPQAVCLIGIYCFTRYGSWGFEPIHKSGRSLG